MQKNIGLTRRITASIAERERKRAKKEGVIFRITQNAGETLPKFLGISFSLPFFSCGGFRDVRDHDRICSRCLSVCGVLSEGGSDP